MNQPVGVETDHASDNKKEGGKEGKKRMKERRVNELAGVDRLLVACRTGGSTEQEGGMLEANVANISMTAKPRELDLRSAAVSCQDSSAQPMASRKPQAKPSTLPQAPPCPSGTELKVYRPNSGSIPIPIPSSSRLRKQRSLGNLCVLTDAEKKLHLYQSPRWNDDASRPGARANKPGQTKTGQAGGGRPPLSRTLSKSEQSLFQGKPKSFCSSAINSNMGKPSRIPAPGKPRGPYAEVKPISKASEVSPATESAEQPLKANSNGAESAVKKPEEKIKSGAQISEEKKEKKGTDGENDKSFLKVDPELVVTVLGDLEQLLFSQMLASQRPSLNPTPSSSMSIDLQATDRWSLSTLLPNPHSPLPRETCRKREWNLSGWLHGQQLASCSKAKNPNQDDLAPAALSVCSLHALLCVNAVGHVCDLDCRCEVTGDTLIKQPG
ncbi:hypothetical protein CRENBAI_008778 [Crenichthys baileyi]|uniref:Neuron navigator 1 n=1 Tax=Crenichthys baileyi TaxID=28760 RepID=A0AAV9RKU2_9TELE